MQADRSVRSVFVGNIPYDATEEKLRDIFSAVGPVLSFRIVFDRETGKPKGYGFCEYKDQETATSAIRNLNGHDLGGRQLRVDSASNERARDEPETGAGANSGSSGGNTNDNQAQSLQAQHQPAAMAKPLVDVHTMINNVMMSLPPEQLFDICKQLRNSLLINPNESRQMLLQNPQLSYAILQSLVMIKAIDAQTAMNSLHKQLMQPTPLQPALPMMAPMVPTIPGAGLPGPPGPGVAPQMVMQSQPMGPATPAVPMQPQVMNPYAFMPNAMVSLGPTSQQQPAPIPSPQAQQTNPIQPVNMPIVTSTPVNAPADPRLARQQQLQQSQPQQQQLQQAQPLQGPIMSEQERQEFLMQVVNMSEREISQLPPDQQDKIYLLRRQYIPGAMS